MKGDDNFEKVAAVSHSLFHGLHDIANNIRALIRSEAWRSFVDPAGRLNEYDDFVTFVEKSPPRGLGSDLKTIKRIVANEKDVLDLLDQVTQGKQGARTDLGNNVPEEGRPEGNTIQKALRRLRKDRPDLHAEVLADNLSAHAAMVAAGFRPKTATIRLDDPERLAQALIRKLGPDDLEALTKFLVEALNAPD